MRRAGLFTVVLALFTAASVAPVSAEEADAFDATTKQAIQTVITKQLEALNRDDAKAAEEFATPAIKDKFPEPAKFFEMVKAHYAALLHARSTKFGETSPSPHGPLQKMTVVASDGTVWEAIYALSRVDGEWRISGCGLQKDASQQDI